MTCGRDAGSESGPCLILFCLGDSSGEDRLAGEQEVPLCVQDVGSTEEEEVEEEEVEEEVEEGVEEEEVEEGLEEGAESEEVEEELEEGVEEEEVEAELEEGVEEEEVEEELEEEVEEEDVEEELEEEVEEEDVEEELEEEDVEKEVEEEEVEEQVEEEKGAVVFTAWTKSTSEKYASFALLQELLFLLFCFSSPISKDSLLPKTFSLFCLTPFSVIFLSSLAACGTTFCLIAVEESRAARSWRKSDELWETGSC